MTYQLGDLDIVANGYTPASYDPQRAYPTVVCTAPGRTNRVLGHQRQRDRIVGSL
ncbi:hypothetical protein J7E36_12420 [Pseudomonas fluorescens]|nr:hypothetical protein [Pseudomonas fluorescens]